MRTRDIMARYYGDSPRTNFNGFSRIWKVKIKIYNNVKQRLKKKEFFKS